MQLNKYSWLGFAFWCQLTLEISTAPSSLFKPSQPIRTPLDTSDQLAISYLQKEALREKRGSASGSGDILQHLKVSIGQGIKNKIGQIAKSSAGASAYFSKSSSAHHHGPPEHGHFPHPHYPPPYYHHPHHVHEDAHGKGFDFWGLKKSVLFTLLQAVKAIKGGVIAIKGQLIKGSGHLLNTKGKILRHGGDALTTIGKSIASSAFILAPTAAEEEEVIHDAPVYPEHHHAHAGYEYTGPTAPVVPLSGPPASYGHSSTGGGGYYHNSVYDGQPPPQQHDGLIILRKIPRHLRHPSDSDVDNTNDEQSPPQHEDHPETSEHNHNYQQHHQQHYEHHHEQQDVQESQKTPAFRPLADSIVPKMKNLVTSVFHSSSYSPTASSPAKAVLPKHPPADNTISHSAISNIQVQPQQASIGSLVSYLEYIRNHQKDTKLNLNKGKSVMYVTPAPPPVADKPSKLEHGANLKAQSTSQSQTVTHQDLKKETVALQQQLRQLQSLQQLQQQLQSMYPYAVAPGQNQGHDMDYNMYGGPVMIDLPANADLATVLAQYQIVPEENLNQGTLQTQQYVQQAPHVVQVQPAPLQTQQLVQIPTQQHQQSQQQVQNLYQMEEPLDEAESSNAFLIHYPDEASGEVGGRSLGSSPNRKPKAKRHSHASHYPTTKLKRLSHLQQMQMMQQQLHHPQRPRKSPTIDVVRSLKFIN